MKRRTRKGQVGSFGLRAAVFLLKSQLLTLLLGLAVMGYIVGRQTPHDATGMPFEELFDHLSVVSYREAPSDSSAHFLVELSSRDRVFREYDVDQRRFLTPAQGRDYRRAISATRYDPLAVRGHVNRGFWLELPDPSTHTLLPEQYEELYRTTLGFVKPLSAVTSVLGTLSGYSIGYRLATWDQSLGNPAVQQRVLATAGIGRMISREAWRRVLLEPVVMGRETDPSRFASERATQRIYSNFLGLALADSNGFIPREAARLDSTGCRREARAMLAFARAVGRAAQDTCDLTSADFSAIEEWASLLDRDGRWPYGGLPAAGEERMRYFGTLAWYGLTPSGSEDRRIWIGPRMLVKGTAGEGFVADEITANRVACPLAWQDWMHGPYSSMGTNPWTAQFLGEARQFAPFIELGQRIAGRVRGGP
jgi:hypothetical protein